MKLSEEFLSTLASETVSFVSNGTYKNMCDPVADEFGYIIEQEHPSISVKTVKAPVKGSKHFVSVLDASDVSGFEDDEFVIVDATIRQFENKLDTSLPEVVILGSSDDWERYYDRISGFSDE